MIRAGTLSLALIAGLFCMQGCNETPVENDLPIALASEDKDDNGFSLYVSSDDTRSVLQYDSEPGAFEGKFAHRGQLIEPEGVVFGPDGNLYVSSRTDEVLRFNGETGKFIDVFASGNGLFDGTTGAFVSEFVVEGSGGLSEPTFITFGPAED
jgi:outer membrane protein assembly factor BamB